MTNPILGFKAFDENFKCRKFQFAVGETYRHEGAVIPCESGFHFCTRPLDVFRYYPTTSRFAVVEGSGETQTHKGDSKVAAEVLTVKREIGLGEFCEEGAKAILAGVDWSGAKEEGEGSAATNTGDHSAATNTGNGSAATNTGYQSAATNTGNGSAATNTGTCSAATNTGTCSAATNTGYQSAATNTGERSAATNTGTCSAATVEGAHSVAIVTGAGSKARGALGCAIVLVERGDNNEIKHIVSRKVDGVRVKANTFYTLRGGRLIKSLD